MLNFVRFECCVILTKVMTAVSYVGLYANRSSTTPITEIPTNRRTKPPPQLLSPPLRMQFLTRTLPTPKLIRPILSLANYNIKVEQTPESPDAEAGSHVHTSYLCLCSLADVWTYERYYSRGYSTRLVFFG